MDELLPILEKVFPILIFAFWVIVSVVARARKKTTQQQAAANINRTDNPQQQSRSQQSQSMNEREYQSSSTPAPINTSDYLKRKLESVFGELTFKDVDDTESKIPKGFKDIYTPETVRENVPFETAANLARGNSIVTRREENKKVDAIEHDKIYGKKAIEETRMQSELDISVTGMQNAILWSEILAPPLALRDE